MFLIPIIATLRGWFSLGLGLWNAMPTFVKVLLVIVAAYFVGYLRGGHKAEIECRAKVERSVADAKAIDGRVAAEARMTAERQAAEANARAVQAEADLHDFAKTATDEVEACRAGAAAAPLNDVRGLGVENGPSEPQQAAPAHPSVNKSPSQHPSRQKSLR